MQVLVDGPSASQSSRQDDGAQSCNVNCPLWKMYFKSRIYISFLQLRVSQATPKYVLGYLLSLGITARFVQDIDLSFRWSPRLSVWYAGSVSLL